MAKPKYSNKVSFVTETGMAVLVDHDGDEYWIPKSMIDEDSEIYAGHSSGDEGELIIPEWLAMEKGMI
jgi:hypothetical protein